MTDMNRSTHTTRRQVARAAAWSAPVIAIGAAAPAIAASKADVIVGKTACTDGSGGLNNIPFTVQTINGAIIPAGTVFTVQYAGGSTRPTWSGLLATNSTVAITPGNDTSTNGGRYGTITFTLKTPMASGQTWDLTIGMDIGAFITGQNTSLSLTSPLASTINGSTSNDSASHGMYFGGCNS